MNVLMISLGDQVISQPDGDTRQRHERYGEAAGHLTMIAYSASGQQLADGSLSPHLSVHAIRGSRALFLLKAIRAGLRHARRPVHLVTSQDPFITGLAGVILSWLLGAPLLVQNHSSFFDNPHFINERPLQYNVYNLLGKWAIRRAAMNRVVNSAERDKYIAMGLAPDRVRVIPMADPTPFAAHIPAEQLAAQRAEWGLDASHKIVLWVGRPVPVKQIPLLLNVMQQVVKAEPLARLVLVGDLALATEDLPATIASRGLEQSTILAGYASFEDLPAIYQAADVYALTSSYEGMPRVISEAGAAGLPVVTMDLPALREAITDGENGYIVPQGDTDTFAARLLELLRNPDRAKTIGRTGRDLTLERFSSERLFNEWMRCWRDTARLAD